MKKHLLLQPKDFLPIDSKLQVIGAFNPGAAVVGDKLVLLVRVAVSVLETRKGESPLLQFIDGALDVSWLPSIEYDCTDSRVLRRYVDGKVFLSSISYFHLVTIDNYLSPPNQWICKLGETILPAGPYETFGIEDPRCTWIDQVCYITYTSVSSHGACTSLMTTTDFNTFHRHGVIFVCENKDVVLFPDRIQGRIFALHRPVSATAFCTPQIWSASSLDAISWGGHHVLATSENSFESDRIGAGSPPIKVGSDYLSIFHASERSTGASRVSRYVGALMKMEVSGSQVRLLQRSSSPLMVPTEPWELDGFVPNVVFPTATIAGNETLRVLYGAADTSIGVADIGWDEVFQALK